MDRIAVLADCVADPDVMMRERVCVCVCVWRWLKGDQWMTADASELENGRLFDCSLRIALAFHCRQREREREMLAWESRHSQFVNLSSFNLSP